MLPARHFLCLAFCIFVTIWQPLYAGGVTIGGTRLVYDASRREATLQVRNSADGIPNLIQSWVDGFDDGKEKAPFIITPPLFRLDPGRENTLRIVYTGDGLPQDRESIFWLNVKAIPATAKTDINRLLITVKTRIKLFYRPAVLRGKEADTAWKKLIFTRNGKQIVIKNPTPYHISLFSLKVGSDSIGEPPMLPPFGHVCIQHDTGNEVVWQAITDYGAITTTSVASLREVAASVR